MVLGWFYRKMFDGMVKEFSDWANEKENKKYITELVDSIADREIARLTGSIGGAQKALNMQSAEDLGPWGQLMPIIKLFLQQRSNNSSSNNALGSNPFGKT